MQNDLFPPKSSWRPPAMLPNWDVADVIVIDLETRDPNLEKRGPGWAYEDGHVAGFSVTLVKTSFDPKTPDTLNTFYLPIGHQNGRNLDKDLICDYMRDMCGTQIPKVFHNALYDIGWLSTVDIGVRGPLFDTMYGAALLDENRFSYSLDNLAKDWCGEGKNEELLNEAAATFRLKNPKAEMWKLPPEYVGGYAEQDTIATYKLWKYEVEHLEKNNLTQLAKMEMDLIPLLFEMRKRGVRVDTARGQQVRDELKTKAKVLNSEMASRFGEAVNVWEAKSIARVFDKENLEYPRTPKSGVPSFTKEFLNSHPHDFPKMVLRARKIDKTINTFLDGMVLGHSHRGRIHPELHPLKSDDGGTVSGRFSCSNPNLQQTSARDPEFGPLIRGLFIPEEGELWGALDYSSQEPRLTVHYAHLMHQEGAQAAVDGYRSNPRMDYHQMVADIAGIKRKEAKTINLGLAYGMGGVKLCHSLGLPTMWVKRAPGGRYGETVPAHEGEVGSWEIAGPEGVALLEKYHEKVPFVKGLTTVCSNLAQERGWIRTAGGRLCRFDHWEPVRGKKPAIKGRAAALNGFAGVPIKRAFTHKALNRLIQGSAADMTKIAMLGLWKEGIVPMLQMHDEIDISVGNEKDWRRAEEIMRDALVLSVPTVVDCEFGKDWGSATHNWDEAKQWLVS